jgi:GT2 family glycosyltransferase
VDTLAIVVLNYNGLPFLRRFLPALLAQADGHPVYVADNASTDASVSWLRLQFPAVRVVAMETNDGYAGGYNKALERILHEYGGATYYALVNSDIEVTSNWIAPILQLLESNAAIAACQPKIRSEQERELFEYAGAAGGYLDYLGYAFCRGRVFDVLESDTGQYDDNRPVFWATGACLFVRASVFHETGGFDPAFFAHMEEIDWCWRVQRLGYSVWTCGQSTVYHVGGGTLHKSNPHKTLLNHRNSLYMLYKNWPDDGLFLGKVVMRLVFDGLSSVLYLVAGQWGDIGAVLKAHGSFYARLPVLNRQRRLLLQQEKQRAKLYERSLVWQYFGKGHHRFGQLDQ